MNIPGQGLDWQSVSELSKDMMAASGSIPSSEKFDSAIDLAADFL